MKKFLFLAVLIFWGIALGVRADSMKNMDMGGGTKSKTMTLTGILVDNSCYLEEGATNNDHDGMKGCGTECLKGGSPAGLLVGKKLYTLEFPAPVFKDYVGQKVEITGKVYPGDQLIPKKAFVIKDGKKEEIKIAGKAMM